MFADGHEIVVGEHSGRVDISMMKFGYAGTGPRCLHAFLDQAGFNVTYEEVTQAEGGTMLKRPEDSVETGEPFSMDVEDVFSIKGRGTVVSGTVRTGVIKPGDEIEIVGSDQRLRTTVATLEMFRKTLPMARAGEKVGVFLQDIKREQVKRGMVLQSPEFESKLEEKAESEADTIQLELRALLQDLPVIQKENISDCRQRIMAYTTPPHPCMFSGSIDEAIDFVAKMVQATESFILSCEGIVRVKRAFLVSSVPVSDVLEIQYEQFWDDGTSAIYSENVVRIGDDQFEVFGSEKSATRMKAIRGDR
jgi:hypothetical protein